MADKKMAPRKSGIDPDEFKKLMEGADKMEFKKPVPTPSDSMDDAIENIVRLNKYKKAKGGPL